MSRMKNMDELEEARDILERANQANDAKMKVALYAKGFEMLASIEEYNNNLYAQRINNIRRCYIRQLLSQLYSIEKYAVRVYAELSFDLWWQCIRILRIKHYKVVKDICCDDLALLKAYNDFYEIYGSILDEALGQKRLSG